MAERVVPDSPSKPFLAGTYVFTRLQAINCARLHRAGVTLWHLKQQFHPNATLKEIVVAIQVGLMIDMDFFNLDELYDIDPKIFNPSFVCLEIWKIGESNQSNEKNNKTS